MSFSESGLARIRLCVESLPKAAGRIRMVFRCSVIPSLFRSELSRAPTLPKWHLPSLQCWRCTALAERLASRKTGSRCAIRALTTRWKPLHLAMSSSEAKKRPPAQAVAKALLCQGFGLRRAMCSIYKYNVLLLHRDDQRLKVRSLAKKPAILGARGFCGGWLF